MPNCSPPQISWPWCDPAKFHSTQCWRCISQAEPYFDGHGQEGADIHGADVGCKPCLDLPNEWFTHYPRPDGLRFLGRSHEGRERDAEGKVGDVASWTPTKFVKRLDLIRANCSRYNNVGVHTECYSGSACDCARKIVPSTTGAGNTCSVPGFLGVGLGARLPGNFPDCFAYHTPLDDAQGVDFGMFVRRVLNGGNDLVSAATDLPWHNTAVHVFGDRDLTPCTVNMITTCTSDTFRGSGCLGALYRNEFWWIENFAGERVPPETMLYESNSVVTDFFRTCGLRNVTARFNTNPHNKWIDRGTALAKNKVLGHAIRDYGYHTGFLDSNGGRRKFDQLETEHFRLWDRVWETSRVACDSLADTDQAVPDVFGICATNRHRGSRLTIQFVLTYIDVSANILLIKQRRRVPPGVIVPFHNEYKMYPHVGLVVRIHGVPVVTGWEGLPDGWRVVNGMTCRGNWGSGQRKELSPDGMPQVLDADGRHVDEILYRDQAGRHIQEFFEVVWNGQLNDFSRPRTYNILETWRDRTWPFQPGNQGVAHGCGSVVEAFDGVLVPGYPVHHQSDANDPAQLFHGSIELTFREGAYVRHTG